MKSDISLLAGAAAVDITPLNYRDVYLAGFAPNRKASGVLDPIYARVLYLNDGQTELAIVSLDLVGLFYSHAQKIRQAVSVMDPENIFLCCTHTHSGPDTMGLWGPAIGEIPYETGVDPRYMKSLARTVSHAIKKAKTRALPATISFGLDGSLKDELTWNVRQPGFLDQAMTVMHVQRVDGQGTIASLVNYASHPETLWDTNTRISPDYPVAIHRTLERALGGVSIYISGALGGMVTPGIDEDAPLRARENFYTSYGGKLAKIALDAIRNAKLEPKPVIDIKTSEVTLPFANKRLYFAAGMGILDRSITKQGVTSQIGSIRIGRAQIATMPGEVCPAVGLRIKGHMQGHPNFFFGLTNDEIGYVLEKHLYDSSLFEYESTVSLGPDTDDAIVNAFRVLND